MVEVPGTKKKPASVRAPRAILAEAPPQPHALPEGEIETAAGPQAELVNSNQPSPEDLGFESVSAPTGEEGELPYGWETVPVPGEERNVLQKGADAANEFLFGEDFTQGDPSGGGGGFTSRSDGIMDRIGDHFLGLDVDDPLPWWRLGTTVAGGVGGTVAGAKGGLLMGTMIGAAFPPAAPFTIPAGGALGAIAGGVGGAVGGSMGPEIFLETGEVVGLYEEGTRERLGLSNSELYIYAQNEALLELLSMGVLGTVRGTVRVGAQAFTGTTRAQMKEATRLAAQGYMMMPVQIGDGVFARGYVSVMGRMPLMGGGGKFGVLAPRALKQEEAIQQVVEGVPNRLGPLSSWHNLGDQFWKDAQGGLEIFTERMGAQFDDAFARSAAAGVTVTPSSAIDQALRDLKSISAETQTFIRETTVSVAEGAEPMILREFYKGDAGKAVQPYIEFVRKEILPHAVLRDGEATGEIAGQSHKVMDQILTKIDQEIASIDPGSRRFTYALFTRLRESIRFDMVANTNGDVGNAIGKELAQLDKEWSETLQQTFQSSIAQHLGTVSQKGIRGRGGAAIKATRAKVSKIAKNIVRDLQSPEEVDDLIRLVGPDTMKEAGAQYINDAIKAGYKTIQDGSTGQWNPDVFIKRLGLLDTSAERRAVTEAILQKTGSDITMQNLDDIALVLQRLASVEIPKVSTYLARRGGIGGARTVLNAVAPGMGAAMGGAAVGGAAGSAGLVSLLGVMSFIGGNQFIFRKLITDPKSAQLLHTVIDQEATMVAQANAYWQLVRAGVVTAHEIADAGSAAAGEVKSRASLMPGQNEAKQKATVKDYRKAADDWHEMMRNEMESRGESQDVIDAFTKPPAERKKKRSVR